MILRLTAHKTSTDIVVVHAGPELGEFMGAFPAARWQAKPKAYWLPVEQLDAFGRYARIKGHVLVDDRSDDTREKYSGPLPECSGCGMPASRDQALKLSRCPGCGVEWRPVVHSGAGPLAFRVECTICARKQRAGYAYCGGCGAPAPAVPSGAPRPPELAPREHLEEPLPFVECVPEHLAELLEEERAEYDDEDRDYAQRAAGDR